MKEDEDEKVLEGGPPEPTAADIENLKFEIPPKLPAEIIPEAPIPPTTPEEDFGNVQENLKRLIKQGSEALRNSIELAQELDKPFAYAAVAQLMNALTAVNKDLLDVHKKKKDYNKNPEEGPKTINQNIYMTTTDVSKLLRREVPPVTVEAEFEEVASGSGEATDIQR